MIFELQYVIKYLCENEKVREIVLACSREAQVEYLKPKNRVRKSHDTIPIKGVYLKVCSILSSK